MAIVGVQNLKRWVRISFDDGSAPLILRASKIGQVIGYGSDFFVGIKTAGKYDFYDLNGDVYTTLKESSIGTIIDVTENGFTTQIGRRTIEYDSDGNRLEERVGASSRLTSRDVRKGKRQSADIKEVDSLEPPPIIGMTWGIILGVVGLGLSITSSWINGAGLEKISMLFDLGLWIAVFVCVVKGPKVPAFSVIGLLIVVGLHFWGLLIELDDEPIYESELPPIIIYSILFVLPLSVSWISSFHGRLRHAGVCLLVSTPLLIVFEVLLHQRLSTGYFLGYIMSQVAYYAAILSVLTGSDSYDTVKSIWPFNND